MSRRVGMHYLYKYMSVIISSVSVRARRSNFAVNKSESHTQLRYSGCTAASYTDTPAYLARNLSRQRSCLTLSSVPLNAALVSYTGKHHCGAHAYHTQRQQRQFCLSASAAPAPRYHRSLAQQARCSSTVLAAALQ